MASLRRFFADRVENDRVEFSGGEARHIFRVLRKRKGDKLLAVFGGMEYVCEIISSEEDHVSALIQESNPCSSDPLRKITLYMACCKTDKMELVAQKSAELGVSAFVPFVSKRCSRIPSDADKFKNRVERIAYEAMKQCGRSDVLEVEKPIGFDELLRRLEDCKTVIFAYEESTGSLREALQNASEEIALIIGCEGGFEPSEAEKIIAAGGVSVSLGRRILRAETAAISLMSLVNYETGN